MDWGPQLERLNGFTDTAISILRSGFLNDEKTDALATGTTAKDILPFPGLNFDFGIVQRLYVVAFHAPNLPARVVLFPFFCLTS